MGRDGKRRRCELPRGGMRERGTDFSPSVARRLPRLGEMIAKLAPRLRLEGCGSRGSYRGARRVVERGGSCWA